MSTEMVVYRRSALEDSDCLYRFNEVHRKGVDDSSDYAIRGQAFALIKSLYILRLVERHVPQDSEEAEAAFIEGIAQHQTPNRLIPELRELWMRHAEVFGLDLDHYVASEDRLVGDGVSITPDLVYARPNELEIRDDKTYWICLTEEEVKQTYQARFLAWRAMRQFPHFPAYRVTFVFVRFNRVASVTFSVSEVEQMELEVRADIARVKEAERNDSWPAIAGPSCRFCELRCPIADRPMVLPARILPAQVGPAAAWLLTAEKATKSVKKALKAYCVTNGPVHVGRVEWANRPVVERKYLIADVLKVLQARGVMGAFESKGSDLTISHSALSKLIKTYPQLAEDLAPFVQEKLTYRFSAGKPGDDAESED